MSWPLSSLTHYKHSISSPSTETARQKRKQFIFISSNKENGGLKSDFCLQWQFLHRARNRSQLSWKHTQAFWSRLNRGWTYRRKSVREYSFSLHFVLRADQYERFEKHLTVPGDNFWKQGKKCSTTSVSQATNLCKLIRFPPLLLSHVSNNPLLKSRSLKMLCKVVSTKRLRS